MKYVIDEKICLEKGLSLESLLAILLVKTGTNISELFSKLEKEQVIVKDLFSSNYAVTQRWDDVASSILLSSDKSVPKDSRIENLVTQLMEIFPKGKKEGTSSTYWRGNKKDNRLRLQKFFKLYGNKYTDSQIIDATKRYVSSFNGNYTYMRVLKYFIWKDAIKQNSEGTKYIEEVSDLATYIENEGQENVNNNWTLELR